MVPQPRRTGQSAFIGALVTTNRWALSRFHRPDYFGDPALPLADAIRERMEELLKKPAMTIFIVAGIYRQALRLYRKGVPYVPYQKERI